MRTLTEEMMSCAGGIASEAHSAVNEIMEAALDATSKRQRMDRLEAALKMACIARLATEIRATDLDREYEDDLVTTSNDN